MNNEVIREKQRALDEDSLIQNLIAQAHARYILFNTAEDSSNFPPYTINDDRLNLLALYYLGIGCSFAENRNFSEAITPLEKGASILEYVHSATTNRQATSNYYGLIGAMAYYVSFQYSKSFILIRKFESASIIARLINAFLQRNFSSLTALVNNILGDSTYADNYISTHPEELDGTQKVYEIIIAKSLNSFLQYFFTGNDELLENAKRALRNIKEIAEIEKDPGIWWVIRLLLLISEGFGEASLWNALQPHFTIQDPLVKRYIQSLVYKTPGVYELFITQRMSLGKVLNSDQGCIVSIPTSSGKTRIAEISILHCMLQDATNKVLYIAPFRSLAFEVENGLEPVLANADITVSHLYGGSLYSQLDEKVIDDSDVIIATPEKAKAILRSNTELVRQIKLVIIDEGHLLGLNDRLIANEIFYEELRYYMEQNNGKFLLLSAVLPNPEELAEWLTTSRETIYKAIWRPSDERLGILEWNGRQVNLNWVSQDHERPSFNNRFVVREAIPLTGRQRTIRYFPGDKNEAVAATAYKLRTFGPVLIFVGQKRSVFTMASAYLKCLGNEPSDHSWKNPLDWRAFELAAEETYGTQFNPWLLYARKGILCHNADLHADVRLPLERLMRVDKPLVIISTSTLGQGVNLGVSTVIFSTLYQAGELINARDFWNIAGRAGRAFVDHEGKILVAADITDMSRREQRQETERIRGYFNKEQIDVARSGILSALGRVKNTAKKNGVPFHLLLELISENKIDGAEQISAITNETFDLVDDTLLSLLLNNNPEGEIDMTWVEDFFRKSLAAIQAEHVMAITAEEVVQLLQARIAGMVRLLGKNRTKWRSIVQSGIPLRSDLLLEDKISSIIAILKENQDNIDSIMSKITLLTQVESLVADLPVLAEERAALKSKEMDLIREYWLTAQSIATIQPLQHSHEIITKYFTFKLPWILNGIAKKLRILELGDEASTIEELAILVETGLPTMEKVKIYQAGIRSRTAADDIGNLYELDFASMSISQYKRDLVSNKEVYKILVSEVTGEWLDILDRSTIGKYIKIRAVPWFTFGEIHKRTNILMPRMINNKQHLVSPGLDIIEDVSEGDVDFSQVNGIEGILFQYNYRRQRWVMMVNNPYVEIIK